MWRFVLHRICPPREHAIYHGCCWKGFEHVDNFHSFQPLSCTSENTVGWNSKKKKTKNKNFSISSASYLASATLCQCCSIVFIFFFISYHHLIPPPSLTTSSPLSSPSRSQIMTERKNAKAMAGGSLQERMQAGLDLPLQGRLCVCACWGGELSRR